MIRNKIILKLCVMNYLEKKIILSIYKAKKLQNNSKKIMKLGYST